MIRNEVKEQMMKKEKRKMNKRETKDGEGDSIIIIIAIIHTRFLLESFWCFLAFIQLERKKGHEKVKKKKKKKPKRRSKE